MVLIQTKLWFKSKPRYCFKLIQDMVLIQTSFLVMIFDSNHEEMVLI